jgi:hypothetical protein
MKDPGIGNVGNTFIRLHSGSDDYSDGQVLRAREISSALCTAPHSGQGVDSIDTFNLLLDLGIEAGTRHAAAELARVRESTTVAPCWF